MKPMAALILKIFGILTAAAGGILLHAVVIGGRGIELALAMALVILVGIALAVVGFLAPRFSERTDVVENPLGYRLRVDARGDVIFTCMRDEVEAALLHGELTYDEYAAAVSRHEYDLRGDSRRVQLAREHQNGELLTSEYADELEALAAAIGALRDAYAAGEIAGEAYEERLRELA